jgi:hypothetical protein
VIKKDEIQALIGKKCWFAGDILEIRKSSDAEIVGVEGDNVVVKHFLGDVTKVPISKISSIRRKDT